MSSADAQGQGSNQAGGGHADGHGGEACHDHGAGGGDCLADRLRAEIAGQIAGKKASAGAAQAGLQPGGPGTAAGGDAYVACPIPSEATDFLHWPWIWRMGQFFLVLAVGWAFWPAAGKLARVCLYLAAAATVVGAWVQGWKGGMSAGAGVAGGWWTRWRAALRMHPERFSGPLWLATAAAIGVGLGVAACSADVERSVNAFVEKADALLIGLLAFIHFQFTAARRQPFWLYGVVAESWLIGLTAIGAGMVTAYIAQTGWPVTADPARAALSGWSVGYATEFGHWMALAGVLAIGRMVGDRVFHSSAADAVTAARIKATRVLLMGGNLVWAMVSVWRWRGAGVRIESIGWPEVDEIVSRVSTVYAERFGETSPWVVAAVGVGWLALMAVCAWRALGQRLMQMRGAAAEQAAAGDSARERSGWVSVGWMALPVLGALAALAAAQKHLAWVAVAAVAAVIGWEALRSGKPARRWLVFAAVGVALAGAAWGLRAEGVARSVGFRRVWWSMATEMIAARPFGHGFGQHIYKAEFQRQFADSGRVTVDTLPADLQPQLAPGWGEQDLRFHRNWLTWELSKGFDPHSVLLQVMFEGGWIWLGILGLAVGAGVWIRGGVSGGPSALVDLLPVLVGTMCLVDIPAEGLEKLFACMMAGWVAYGCRPAQERSPAAAGHESTGT